MSSRQGGRNPSPLGVPIREFRSFLMPPQVPYDFWAHKRKIGYYATPPQKIRFCLPPESPRRPQGPHLQMPSPNKTKGRKTFVVIRKLSRTSVACVMCAEADWLDGAIIVLLSVWPQTKSHSPPWRFSLAPYREKQDRKGKRRLVVADAPAENANA